jgi:Ca2+-transporting ATPase
MTSSKTDVSVPDPGPDAAPPYAQDAVDVAAGMGSDPVAGLTDADAVARLARYGPNQITGEKPPSVLTVALTQLRDPMNIMLVAVTAVSFAIGQISTGVIVGLLILLNVVLGSRQELKARASVDALSNLQVPQAKVVRLQLRTPKAQAMPASPLSSAKNFPNRIVRN